MSSDSLDGKGEKCPLISGQPGTSRMFAPVTKKPRTQRVKDKGAPSSMTPVRTKHTKKTSEGTAGDVNKDKPVKRRSAVYHDEEAKYPGNSRNSYQGRRSSGSVDDYVKGSTSDEYKRRLNETCEKLYAENVVEDPRYDYFYDVAAVLLALVIVILATTLIFFHELTTTETHTENPSPPSLQVERYQFGSMSEEIDCSIHMKRRALQGDSLHDVVRQGLMCLYTLAPYVVHEFSSMQLIVSYMQTDNGLMKSFEMFNSDEPCDVNDIKDCDYRQFSTFVSGFGYHNGTLRDSELVNVWLEQESVNTSHHMDIWTRAFLLSYRNTTNLSREDSITITAEEAEETARIFATNNVKRKSNITDNLFHLFLNERDDNFMELVFPEPHVSHTLSFLSAFIIKVAYEAYTKIYPKDAELTLDYISLNAQHIALQMLEGTREWSGNETDPSLLGKWKEAIEQIMQQSFGKSPLHTPLKVTRKSTDRVTSLVAWNNDKYKEWLVMLEMGIPHVFDPKGGTNQMIEYQPFIHEDGSKSVPYSSAAGVIVMKKYQHDIAQPYIVASASGSERTVEGVVNSVLNLLLFNHTYHGALAVNNSYVNYTNGITYCNYNASLHFKEKFGFHCVENINETNVLDRSMMLGWRPRRSKSLHMALSGPEELYNYATGY